MIEPHISFRHAALKINWARKQIASLETAIRDWIDAKPFTLSFSASDDEPGVYRCNVGLTDGMPASFALLIGDVISNLRAALDFAWMGLVRAAAPEGTNPSKKTMPIADNRQGLISTIEKAPIGGAVEEAKILLLDRVRSHRDIADGGNVALVALNELSNWNKHNLLITMLGVTRVTGVTIGGMNIGAVEVEGNVCTPIAIERANGVPNFEYSGEPTVELMFGAHDHVEGKPVVMTLLALAQASTNALRAFCERFPDEGNPTFAN